MSDEMKKFFELMAKLKIDSVIRFTVGDEEVSIACDGLSILENVENAKVEQDEDYKWAHKVTAHIGKFDFFGYVDIEKYKAYIEAKQAKESKVA